jgi:tRNA 5-methylaminomethyl-2-thiouridine biosynthesis bifunctional protein
MRCCAGWSGARRHEPEFRSAQHEGTPVNTRRRTLLHIGEAAVHSLLQTWEAWRQDAAPEDRLTLLAITPHPPDRQTLQLALQPPPDTHNLHRLAFDAGRVHLLLAVGSAWQWLPELQAQADEIQLDAPDFSADSQRGLRAASRWRGAVPSAL